MCSEADITDHPLVAIVGPTAVGKTNLVLNISTNLDAEIISVDSMQVYRFMDIGTAKPTKEEQALVPHHLVDIADPDDEYNVQRFVKDADTACRQIINDKRLPLLTGGTGLYLQSFENGLFDIPAKEDAHTEKERLAIREQLVEKMADEEGRAKMHSYLEEIDPVSASRIHMNDRSRMVRALEIYELTGTPWSAHLARQKEGSSCKGRLNILKIGLTTERELLYERVNKRTDLMMKSGLLEEVETLLKMGYSPSLKSMQSIGYKHINEYLAGNWNLEETREYLARDTRHYAKRQFTWFNRDKEILWFKPDQINEIEEEIKRFIDKQQ